jgi:hypothetical protein
MAWWVYYVVRPAFVPGILGSRTSWVFFRIVLFRIRWVFRTQILTESAGAS